MQTIDPRTRMVLFKILNRCISTGKEVNTKMQSVLFPTICVFLFTTDQKAAKH
jgi:hypothetical protein